MNAATKEKRIYNVTEYAEKARKALKKMEEEQTAGQATTGGKITVLSVVKDELKELLEKGYTTQQIADALKDGDVFAILPKSITTIVHGKKKTVRRAKPAEQTSDLQAEQQKGSKTGKAVGNAQSTQAAGTFKINPDSEDL